MSAITVDRAVLEQALRALEFVGEDMPHWAAVKRAQAITTLRTALAQEEQFISLQELAEALGSPDIDSDSEIDKHDLLEMVELQRELLFHAISLNAKMRKRKT